MQSGRDSGGSERGSERESEIWTTTKDEIETCDVTVSDRSVSERIEVLHIERKIMMIDLVFWNPLLESVPDGELISLDLKKQDRL